MNKCLCCLTTEESRVLQLVIDGADYRHIAFNLESTTESAMRQVRDIFVKLNHALQGSSQSNICRYLPDVLVST